VQKFYFDRGFLDTVVRLENVQEDEAEHTVRLELLIEEGAPTLVTEVRLTGTVPPELPPAQQLLAALPLRPGARITKAAFDRSKDLLLTRLQDAGCAGASRAADGSGPPGTHGHGDLRRLSWESHQVRPRYHYRGPAGAAADHPAQTDPP
jgi:hypothetical protein